MWVLGCASPSSQPPKANLPAVPVVTDTGLGSPAPDSGDGPDPDPADSGWTAPDLEAGDTPAEARELPSPSPALTVSDAIDPPGDVDWFQVDLDAGDTLWIAALAALRSTPSPLAPRLEVRDATDRVLHVVRGMPLELGGLDSALAFEARTSGPHYIGISAADPHSPALDAVPELGGPDHAYSLMLERAEPLESEPHNDDAAALLAWLSEPDHFAYRGDPFIAGWPLFSMRATADPDRDLLPWTVRGEAADGTPAAWELWSYSPWPGCAPSSTWQASTGAPDAPDSVVLGTAHLSTLTTDPLWRLARPDVLLFPDVGLLVAAPPGELWLTVDHDPGTDAIGSACTGVLAGWTTENIDRWADLSDVPPTPRVHTRSDGSLVSLVWGDLGPTASHTLRIPASGSHPRIHVQVQAATIGHDVDIDLTLSTDRHPALVITTDAIDGSPDPAAWNLDVAGAAHLDLQLTATEGSGAYLLQVHQTTEALP